VNIPSTSQSQPPCYNLEAPTSVPLDVSETSDALDWDDVSDNEDLEEESEADSEADEEIGLLHSKLQ